MSTSVAVEVRPTPIVVEVHPERADVAVRGESTTVDVTAPVVEVDVTEGGRRGPAGPAGRDGRLHDGVAADPMSVLSVVWLDVDDRLRVATSLDPATARLVVGVSTTSALPGDPVTWASTGAEVEHDVAVPLGPLYLSPTGTLTAERRTGVVELRVGTATSPGRLVVGLHPTIAHE